MLQHKTNSTKAPEVTLRVENPKSYAVASTVPVSYDIESFGYVSGKKYIPFFGGADDMPAILLQARLTSVTQNACISAISYGVVGKGLKIDKANPDADFLEWMKCVNNHLHSFNEFLIKTLDGERSFGNQFIEVKRGEVLGQKFLKVYCHPITNCRLKEADETGQITSVLISKQFAKRGGGKYLKNALEIPLWSPNIVDQPKCWKANKDGTESTMLHFKNEVSGVEYYGLPDSISGLPYQLEEKKLVQYNIDNLDNNMILGGMLMFKSAMTREEAVLQAQDILLSHVGEGKTGRIAVISSENGLDDVKFEKYETQKEGSFKEREKTLERKIILANNYHAALLGLEESGAMGRGSSYIRGIYDAVDAQLLNPLEKRVMAKVVSPIVSIYADHFKKPEIKDYVLTFESAMPYSLLADLDPETFTTVDEARALTGKDPDPVNGKKYLSEQKNSKNVPPEPATT